MRLILLRFAYLAGASSWRGDGARARVAQVGDVVVESARGDSQQLGDRGDGAAGVGQEAAGGADDFLGGDDGAPADAAAGGGQALVGADDDEFADELREGRENVEDEPADGGGAWIT
ncbi:hypothetical protein ACIRU3_41160 [Streptomyces sp. NPDC101151]|uniref:hypothetical protein n=1 Tax=Streptomyces sp. NPDC101151 TaxID=3366115 RepID=UPI0037F8FAEA